MRNKRRIALSRYFPCKKLFITCDYEQWFEYWIPIQYKVFPINETIIVGYTNCKIWEDKVQNAYKFLGALNVWNSLKLDGAHRKLLKGNQSYGKIRIRLHTSSLSNCRIERSTYIGNKRLYLLEYKFSCKRQKIHHTFYANYNWLKDNFAFIYAFDAMCEYQ